nr:uncharacterized protein LOC109163234 [Ipomoea batatas]
MESDLSVSEISGDDDSQLPRNPELDATPKDLCSKSSFTSPIKALKVSTDPETPSCSFFKDSSNKENLSTSKSEVQKLSMEPHKMKRKKTGGYNLRKSLAWNKAFFTEEGVLDPMELSMISGGGLSPIEERKTPQSSKSLRNVAPSSMKSIKKNVCKEISATSSKEDREKSSHKVFATPNGRTSSMGGGCPRPLFSASLKRPANINVSKAAIKESKLPKFQVSKPGSCSMTTNSKSTMPGPCPLQNKKISDPVSVQRKYGLKSSLRNAESGQKKAKDGSIPPDLSLAAHPKGDSDISTLNINLSNSSSLLPIRKNGNTSLKVIPDPVAAYSSIPSSQGQDGSAPPAVSRLQNTFTSVRSLQHAQIQTIKPSGLRMPSPSLGFFRQPKASETHRLSQRNAESSVQKLYKSGDLRPPLVVGGQKINDTIATMDGRNISTRLGCSGASDSQKAIKACLDDDDALKNRLKARCDYGNPKLLSDKNEKHNVSDVDGKVNDHGEVRNEKIGSQQDTESWMNGKELLNTGECRQTLEKDDPKVIGSQGSRGSSRSDLEDYQLVSQQNSLVHAMDTFRAETAVSFDGSLSDSGSEDMDICGDEEMISNCPVSGSQDVGGLPEEQSDKKSCAFEADRILIGHNYATVTEHCLNKLSREFQNYGSQDSADPNLIGLTCTKVETKNSAFPTDDLHIQSSEENATRNEGSVKSDLGDSVLHTSKEILYAHSFKNTIPECLRAVKAEEEKVSKTVSSIELNGKDATDYNEFDVQRARIIAEIDTVMIAGQVFHDDVLLHPAQDSHSVESPDIFDKASPHLKFALSNETLKLVVPGTPESLNGSIKLNNDVCVAKNDFSAKEIDKCYDNPNNGTQIVKINDSELLEDSQKCERVNFSESVGQKNHSEYISKGSSEGLLLEVEHSQSVDGEISPELCNVLTSSALSIHHYSAISAEKLEQSDKPILPGQGTGTVSDEESERNQVLDCVSQLSDVSRSVVVSSSALNLEPTVGGIDTKIDSFDADLHIEDKPSDYVGNDSLPEGCELTNSVLLLDTLPNGKSACLDIDSAPQTSKNCISRESAACIDLLESEQESSRSNEELDQNILGDESEMKTSETINSHASELCLELDNANCFTNNENATLSIKRPEDGKAKSKLTVIPPWNAVPFSDEWLAAIEAAGEDILAMKGGAVQNSPPDKSLPEPSPWSPVRRKNNQAGPFDCTKFTRNRGAEPS